tara:strand:+ start:413 stop:685 length:273 start_codon:yes stop_codon:yes gene_type:complete
VIDIMNKVLADNLVESFANMNQEQRDKFVDTFVSKWPLLAGQISFSIESNLQDAEYKKVEVKDLELRLDPNKKAYIQKVKQEDREVISVN